MIIWYRKIKTEFMGTRKKIQIIVESKPILLSYLSPGGQKVEADSIAG